MQNAYGKTLSRNIEVVKVRYDNQSPNNCAACNNSGSGGHSAGTW